MLINNANLKFKGPFEIRIKTEMIIIHHSGVNVLQSVETIHEYYLNRDNGTYNGIGYHYYVRKDGTVWQGRPENTVGAHCYAHNANSIGICFEGDYENNEIMPTAQYRSGVSLLKDILSRYKSLVLKKHNDFNATDCPGVHFPFVKMVDDVAKKVVAPVKPVKPVLKVGSKIMIIGENAVYGGASQGIKIGKVYKNKSFTVQMLGAKNMNNGQVLIKELFSWVYVKDIKII